MKLEGDYVIGLGGQRCGSTWLHTQIAQHPDISCPSEMKEVHFFDRYFERGPEWYAGLFEKALQSSIIWECTPNYLYHSGVPERIEQTIAAPKFVVLLREPISRSISHYERFLSTHGKKMSFSKAIEIKRNIVRYSEYSKYLKKYIKIWGRDRIHVIFYEDISYNPNELISRTSKFLGVSECGFPGPKVSSMKRVNSAQNPRFPKTFVIINNFKRKLRDKNMNAVFSIGKTFGVDRFLDKVMSNRHSKPKLSDSEKDLLSRMHLEEIERLEKLGISTERWLRR